MVEKKLSMVRREKLYKKNFEADICQTLYKEGDELRNKDDFYEPLAEFMVLILQLERVTNNEKANNIK